MGNRVGYIIFLCFIQYNCISIYGINLTINHNTFLINNFTNNNNTYYAVAKSKDLDICKLKTCINKCCPENTYVTIKKKIKTCEEYKQKFIFDYSTIDLYDKNKNAVLTTLGKSKNIHLVADKFSNETFKYKSFNGGGFRSYYKTYLTEEGVFYLQSSNTYERWIRFDKDKFCVDYQLSTKNISRSPVLRVWIVWDAPATTTKTYWLPIALSISCFFLFIVMIVYILLSELRNLCGMILMAYVGSLFWAFLLLAIIQSGHFVIEVCIGLTLCIYFSFMSSFCWMNVMSYDIWWTFRGYAKARPIHRRGVHFKFAMYCLYSWGLPLVLTIFTGIMDIDNMFSDKPWVVQPNIGKKGCFMDGGEKLYYLYSPMLILILSNWLMYLMTAFNIWRLSRGTGVLDSAAAGTPAAHRTHRNRFMVYLKLSVVMGLNWVLEVVSFLYPGLRVWYFSDAYNMLMGFFIFLIFVCKVKIFKKLCKRFRNYKTYWLPSTNSYTSSTTDSVSNQDASLQGVCCNPKGPAYPKQ